MRIYRGFFFFFWGGGWVGWGSFYNLLKLSNKQLTTEQSSGIHTGLTKVLHLWKVNHGNDFVKH